MGFTAEQATLALQAANGDLDLAVELLLQQSEAGPVPKGEGKGTGKGKPAAPPHAVMSHLDIDGGEAADIGILPTTRWDQIQPARPYLDELTSNAKILSVGSPGYRWGCRISAPAKREWTPEDPSCKLRPVRGGLVDDR